MSRRQIFKGRNRAEHDVEHLLQSILAAELISPSELLWLVSPWVSDVAVLDNRSGALTGLEPTWASRSISLVEVLVALLRRGTRIVVATRTDAHNRRFLDRLAAGAHAAGVDKRLRILQDEHERLHEKGLLGDDYYLSGSMNFTQSGIRLNDEAVKYELDEEAVARARVHFRQHYGTPGA